MRAHQGALRAFLRRLTRDAALADDLAQIAFMKAFKNQQNLRDPSSVEAWLFQIGYRVFINEYRKTVRRRALDSKSVDLAQHASDPGLSTDIESAMNSLSEECRAVVILCLAHGMTHTEVSNITNIPLGTVKSHVTRGKSKLRTFLSAYETTR